MERQSHRKITGDWKVRNCIHFVCWYVLCQYGARLRLGPCFAALERVFRFVSISP